MGSTHDDIRLHVARSYGLLYPTIFSGIPLFLLPCTCTFITIALAPSYAVFLSSHHMPIPLQSTFLYFLRDFLHVRCPSYSFISDLVHAASQLRTSFVAFSFVRLPIYFPVPSSTPMALPRTSVLVLPLSCTPSP